VAQGKPSYCTRNIKIPMALKMFFCLFACAFTVTGSTAVLADEFALSMVQKSISRFSLERSGKEDPKTVEKPNVALLQNDEEQLAAEKTGELMKLKDTSSLVQATDDEFSSQGLISGPVCAKQMGCDLQLNGVSNSNMDGSDKSKPAELRYSKVCVYQGMSIDMVVVASGPYVGKPGKNGKLGKLGIISMQAGTSSTFVFSFVKSGTTTPVTISLL
jgi:hypothetical protein